MLMSPTNRVTVKLLRQIDNLEDSIHKIDRQINFLAKDLAYDGISQITFEARKVQLLQARTNILGCIEFLNSFYENLKGNDDNEVAGT